MLSRSGQHLRDVQHAVGKGRGGHAFAGPAAEVPGVAPALRLAVDVHARVGEIHDPVFLNSAAGIRGELCRAVEAQRAVCHFYRQENVAGPRQVFALVHLRAQQQNVRLRFGKLVEVECILAIDDAKVAEQLIQAPVEPANRLGVVSSDGGSNFFKYFIL